jgi:hypothetical protein
MRRAVREAGLAVALLATAVVTWSTMPTKLQSWAPIVEHGALGEQVSGRNLTVTVRNAVLTREVTMSTRGKTERVPTSGVWLVLDVSYTTIDTFDKPTFQLDAGGRHFTAYFGGFNADVGPGITDSAPVAFELPEKPSSATVLVFNSVTDKYGNKLTAPLDSQISVEVDLVGAPVTRSVDLDLVGQ